MWASRLKVVSCIPLCISDLNPPWIQCSLCLFHHICQEYHRPPGRHWLGAVWQYLLNLLSSCNSKLQHDLYKMAPWLCSPLIIWETQSTFLHTIVCAASEWAKLRMPFYSPDVPCQICLLCFSFPLHHVSFFSATWLSNIEFQRIPLVTHLSKKQYSYASIPSCKATGIWVLPLLCRFCSSVFSS